MQGRTARNASDGRRERSSLTVGERISRRRKELGWTQPVLAHRMIVVGTKYDGVAQPESLVTMISKWEKNKIEPSEYNRRVLAEAMGVQVSDLGMTKDPDFTLTPTRLPAATSPVRE